MKATSEIKLTNHSGIPDVGFRGTTTNYKFATDVDDGFTISLKGVPVGHYTLTASRFPAGAGLVSTEFDVTETMGIGAVLIPDPRDPTQYRIVVECFVIPHPST